MNTTAETPTTAEAVARRNELAVRWLPLVHRIARDWRGTRVERDDLIGIGRLALVIACDTADPEHERLKHYLANAIRRAIRDEAYRRAHLRHEWDHDRSEVFPDRSPAPGSRAERDDEALATKAMVGPLLAVLPSRERMVVRLVFGLGGDEPMEQADLGRELGISRERAGQLVSQALRRMAVAGRGGSGARS